MRKQSTETKAETVLHLRGVRDGTAVGEKYQHYTLSIGQMGLIY